MNDRRRRPTPKLGTALLSVAGRTGRIVAVVGLAAALAVLVGCSSASPADDVDRSAKPSGPTATADVGSPSSGDSDPSAVPIAPPASPSMASTPFVAAGLGPDTLGVVVATEGLRVRSLPTVGEASERFEPTLPEGVRFYSVAGPVTADGYAWYQVQPYGGDEALPFGWIAGGSRDGEPWIEPFPLGCDTVAPSAEGLVSGEPLEHLFCSLAGESPRTSPPGPDVAVEGDVYCTLADDHWGALSGPEWIDQLGYCELRTDVGSMRVLGAPMTQSLGGPTNPVEGRYAMIGHFDDPGAAECREGAFDEGDEPDPAQVVLRCRTYFVVTEATRLS